jgi:hypothetical protein
MSRIRKSPGETVLLLVRHETSHQDLPGYEQKLHLRPTTLGECAVQHEAELETERR